MKLQLHSFLLVILLTSFSLVSLGQLSDKELKAEIKSLTPEKLREMKQDMVKLSSENESLKADLKDSKGELTKLKGQVAELEQQLKEAKKPEPVAASPQKAKSSSMEGIVYKVQIGSFRDKNLTKYFDNNPNFSGDVDADGQKKYTLGNFREYWEADTFKKYLREMGVKDAWIVSYKDGKRVPIKDVLEGVYSN